MPATGPELTRRALLFGAALFGIGTVVRADSADEVWAVLSTMASDLSEGHASEFLRAFDPAMPGFAELRRDVAALLAQGEVQSSIEVASNQGDDRRRKVEVDWLLRISSHDAVASVNREERVKAGFEKQGKRWRVVSWAPQGFFAPIHRGAALVRTDSQTTEEDVRA